MNFYSRANETGYHKKGFELAFVLNVSSSNPKITYFDNGHFFVPLTDSPRKLTSLIWTLFGDCALSEGENKPSDESKFT